MKNSVAHNFMLFAIFFGVMYIAQEVGVEKGRIILLFIGGTLGAIGMIFGKDEK